MEHHQILPFLHVIGSATIFLVGGLGVGDKESVLREIPILHHAILFVELGPRGSLANTHQNSWTGRINLWFPCCCSSWLLKENWVGVVHVSFSVDKMPYSTLKCDTISHGVFLKKVEKFVAIQFPAPCIYLTFTGPRIVIYSYNKSQWYALFLNFIW
jgi:hypothetical protein